MPKTIALVTTGQKITHDPTATLAGDPMSFVGDNPYGEMTDDIIFGGVNTFLQWVDDATGLDLLDLVTPLESLLGTDTGLLSGLLGFLTPTSSTTGGGIFGPLLGLIPGLGGGTGTLGGLGGFLNPTSFLGSAAGIFGPLLGSGTFLGSLIPGLDASKITSGTLSASLLQPLIDAVSTGFGGSTGLSFSGLLTYLGGLTIGGISFDDIIGLIPGIGTGLSGSTGLGSIFDDLTNLLGSPTGLGTGDTALPDIDSIPILGPLISPMLTALTGSGAGSSSALMTALGQLLNGNSSLFSGNLFGQIGPGLMGVVPASHIATVSPNLIDDGSFNDPSALAFDPVWSFDATQDHTGITGSGSAKVTANGVAKDLSSDLIPVAAGHVLAGSGWVMWSALAHAGGTTPIRLALTCYQNTGTQNRPVWSVVATPDLAVDSSGLTGSGWRQLAGGYTIPAGTDAVRLRCHVDASATAGVINWDDLSLTKTQPIPTSAIGGLDTALSGFTSSISGLLDSLGLHVTATDFNAAITALTGGLGSTTAAINTWVSGLLTGTSTLNANNIGTGAVNLAHLPDVQSILDGIGSAIAGLIGGGVTHSQATDVLAQQANALVGAQAAIQQLQSTLGSGVTAADTFNRSGAIGSNWAVMPVGGTVFYPHGGAGAPACDGNNLAWVGSGNTPNTKLYRWVGANAHSSTNFQNVGIILSGQGEAPLFGAVTYDHILCRVSDDGLNYVRGQFSAYAGNNDDIQLFYCIGGVETNFFVGGFSPAVGKGSAINLLAGLKGSNTRTYTIYVNMNPIFQVTESGAVSQVGAGFMGWGLGLSAGNNGGIIGIQQALPGPINQWSAQDQ